MAQLFYLFLHPVLGAYGSMCLPFSLVYLGCLYTLGIINKNS